MSGTRNKNMACYTIGTLAVAAGATWIGLSTLMACRAPRDLRVVPMEEGAGKVRVSWQPGCTHWLEPFGQYKLSWRDAANNRRQDLWRGNTRETELSAAKWAELADRGGTLKVRTEYGGSETRSCKLPVPAGTRLSQEGLTSR